MRTKRKNGSDYEATPQIAEYDDTTESEKHEYAEWMRFNLPLKRALKDIFADVLKN